MNFGDRPLDPLPDRIARILASITETGREEEATLDRNGQPWRRIDIGFSGELDGYVLPDGPVASAHGGHTYLYDTPEVTAPQEGLLVHNPLADYPLPPSLDEGLFERLRYATSTFRAEQGAGMTLLVPADPAAWNGKLFVVQHGSGTYKRQPRLVQRDGDTPFPLGTGASHFAEWMVDAGYAVAHFRRDAIRPGGGISEATLADGSSRPTTHLSHLGQILAYVSFARDRVEELLGAPPRLTLWYGHSGGGIAGRLINQFPLFNQRPDGGRLVDGILADDTGNGLYLPVALGRTLYENPDEREAFVPQIDITRHLYFPKSFRAAKRFNARAMLEAGLGQRYRYYELLQVSHFEASMSEEIGPRQALDLGPFMAAQVRALDQWVEASIPPVASRAELPGFDPPLVLPEVAAPLGVFYAPDTGGVTRFFPFDGASEEPPLGERIEGFLDANGNGIRDRAETVTEAWRRLGLIEAGETVSEGMLAAKLENAAADLATAGLLPDGCADWYSMQAGRLLRETGAKLA